MSDIEISVTVTGVDGVTRQLDTLMNRMATLPDQIGVELIEWQREDMHRLRPNISAPDPMTRQTTIWPRSRLSMMPNRKRRPRHSAPRRPVVLRRGRSHRPILRQELIDRMVKRMRDLMERSVTWD